MSKVQIFQTGEGVQQMIDVVCDTLQGCFPDVEILVDEPQVADITEPYFLVLLHKVSQHHELGRRYYRHYMFDIQYFTPEADRSNLDLHQIAEQLYDQLEIVIHSTGSYTGTEMNHEIVEGVLHFYVDYSFHVIREKQAEVKMKELKQEGKTHG